MSEYPTLDSLLQDAQLRLTNFGEKAGLLIVEGHDDKRLLCTRTIHRQQVLVASGRRKLLAAHNLANTKGVSGIAFLTDCDYEVTRGKLSPSENLIITEHLDIEADLFDLFGFEKLVTELVPQSLHNDNEFQRITSALRERTVAFADALGKIRLVALDHGCTVDTLSVRHQKYRKRNSSELDISRLVRTLVQNSPDCPIGLSEFEGKVIRIPSGYDNCNGHDLVAAVHHILREDFAVRGQSVDAIAKLLRISTSNDDFQRLKISEYIKRWEAKTGRAILKS